MKSKIDYTAICVVFVLGLFHTVMTLLYYRPFDLGALMYVGSGLAFLFVAFFNVARVRIQQKLIKVLCLVCNVITSIFVFLIALKFPDPRAYIVCFALLVLLGLSVLDFNDSVSRKQGLLRNI